MSETQNFRTSAASAYLASRGVAVSRSYLEKCRTRGVDDPRDRGPDFLREDGTQVCWYPRSALDQYAARRLAARQLRAPAAQPEQLRRRGSDQAA
jgi:hypothetical protein